MRWIFCCATVLLLASGCSQNAHYADPASSPQPQETTDCETSPTESSVDEKDGGIGGTGALPQNCEGGGAVQ